MSTKRARNLKPSNFHSFSKNKARKCDERPLPEGKESETMSTMQVRVAVQRLRRRIIQRRCNPLFRNILPASVLQSIFCSHKGGSFVVNFIRIKILPPSIQKAKSTSGLSNCCVMVFDIESGLRTKEDEQNGVCCASDRPVKTCPARR